jgi:sugar/nucleoside kinase (ribokinase family)
MKKFDVIVVGELNVDLILGGFDGVLPEMGKEINASEMIFTLGSSTAIMAANLSVLGPKTTFVGRVGKDYFANQIFDNLKEKKVDTSNIIQSSEHKTGITVSCAYGDNRYAATYPGAMDHLTIRDIKPEILSEARHMHYSSVFFQKGMKPDLLVLFKMAKDQGLTTSLDCQWDPYEKWDIDLLQLLPFVDIFLPNLEELKLLTGTDSMEKALNKISEMANIVVIKDGTNGSHLWNEGKLIHQSIFRNPDVADAIGAGDSFDAGFISRFIQGKSLNECLEFGALTGAINTTQPGGTTAFVDLKTVRSIAENQFNIKI